MYILFFYFYSCRSRFFLCLRLTHRSFDECMRIALSVCAVCVCERKAARVNVTFMAFIRIELATLTFDTLDKPSDSSSTIDFG